MKITKEEILDILFGICEDDAVYAPDTDLVESGLLDSFAMIELFDALDCRGIELQPTRIDRSLLKTVDGIVTLANGES